MLPSQKGGDTQRQQGGKRRILAADHRVYKPGFPVLCCAPLKYSAMGEVLPPLTGKMLHILTEFPGMKHTLSSYFSFGFINIKILIKLWGNYNKHRMLFIKK